MAERNHRKVRIGIVSSDKMDKTIVVDVDSPRRHPLYGKLAKNTNHFKAHDELNEAKVGDRVNDHGNPSFIQDQKMAPRRNP
mgnify:CR=1 FL=1